MNKQISTASPAGRAGFSLIEVLAAVSIIGIIAFLALPNIVRIKQDSEINMAIARAEAINLAVVSYVQANGFANAQTEWASKSGDTNPSESRYDLAAPYLAFAPANLAGNPGYMPLGYAITLPGALTRPMSKVGLVGPDGPDSGTAPDAIAY